MIKYSFQWLITKIYYAIYFIHQSIGTIMQALKNVQIKSMSLFEQRSLLINFNQEWFQENINQLKEYLLEQCSNIKELEVTIGADRAYIRFEYQRDFFTFQFECNSQSAWIEAEDETSRKTLPQLFSELDVIINKE